MYQPQRIATVCDRVVKRSNNQGSLESRIQGNLHVRFEVGAGVKFPGPHHAPWPLPQPASVRHADADSNQSGCAAYGNRTLGRDDDMHAVASLKSAHEGISCGSWPDADRRRLTASLGFVRRAPSKPPDRSMPHRRSRLDWVVATGRLRPPYNRYAKSRFCIKACCPGPPILYNTSEGI